MQRVVVHPDQIAANSLTLTPEQTHYLCRVLRLQPSDRFLALDGQGGLWVAVLQDGGAHANLTVAQEDVNYQSPLPTITLAACLPKQGFDEVVRQVTELGVQSIVPILSDRTLLRPSAHKLQRWRRIAAEAAEQSERLLVPLIEEPTPWSAWLTQESQDYQKYICVARQTAPSLAIARGLLSSSIIVVAIGPEGGWTDTEIAAAIAQDYQPVSLGKGILRAVTAPVSALSLIQARFEFATIYPFIDTNSWTPLKP